MNYANIAWASTYATKLKKEICYRNKLFVLCLMKTDLSHSGPPLQKINAVNVYQINLYQHLNFMHKVNCQETPRIFNDLIKKTVHKYPTNFSKSNFCLKNVFLNSTKYSKYSKYSMVQNYGIKFPIKKKKNSIHSFKI